LVISPELSGHCKSLFQNLYRIWRMLFVDKHFELLSKLCLQFVIRIALHLSFNSLLRIS
jgi:hypothetical protein